MKRETISKRVKKILNIYIAQNVSIYVNIMSILEYSKDTDKSIN